MSPRVLFEPDTGRLRLDLDAFDSLHDWASGEDVNPSGFHALHKAGVVSDNQQPHPAITPAFSAIAEPECLFTLYINATDNSTLHGAGWMSANIAALLLDTDDELVELVTLAPAFMPAALARVLDISPRPTPTGEPVHTALEVLEKYFSIEHPHTTQPAPDVLTIDGTRRWEISLNSPEHSSTLRVADTPSGYWHADTSNDTAILQPVTPTTIMRQLLQQFPV